MSIRVVIADDHPVVRDGLRLAIERSKADIVVVGEASDGMEVLKFVQARTVDVFILDISMPNMNGIETARELIKANPAASIIILSLHDTKAVVEEAFAAGARGYLTKEMATRNVIDAVIEVNAGRYFLCPAVAQFAIEAGFKRKKSPGRRGIARAELTGQERKVLQLIGEGQGNKQIAEKLNLTVNTVHTHRNNVMAKLNIHKQSELVRYALKAGIAKL